MNAWEADEVVGEDPNAQPSTGGVWSLDEILRRPGPKPVHTKSASQFEQQPFTMKGAQQNITAGFENLTRGVRQVTGLGEQETDEQIRQRRIRDERLGQMPFGEFLQGAGESAPLVMVPFGGLAGAATLTGAKVAGRALPQAMGAAVQESARKFATNPNIFSARNTIGGAAGGAAGGALAPVTSDESRGENAARGAAFGAVAPAVVGATVGTAKATGRAFGALRDSPKLAQRRAVETVENALDEGRGLDEWARRDLVKEEANRALSAQGRTALPRSVSTAGATDSAAIAGLEKQSRGRAATKWRDKDDALEMESRGMLTNVLQPVANQRGGRLSDQAATRARIIGDIDRNTDPAATRQALNAINAEIGAMRQTGAGNVPPVRKALTEARRMIGLNGAGIDHLHNLRSWLTDEAPKAGQGERQIRNLIAKIDSELNTATGNKWQNFLDEYGERANAVAESDAAENILRKFVGPGGERMGNITADAVDRAKAGARNDFGPLLTPPVSDDLRYLVEGLRQAEAPRRVQATPPTGDDPAGAFRRGWHNPFNRAGPAQLIDFLRGRTRKSTLRELDDMLLDPERFAEIVGKQGNLTPKQLVDYLRQIESQSAGQTGAAMERR